MAPDSTDMPLDYYASKGIMTDPLENFGIFDMHGMWFIRGNVVRDFLSLNKIELLPWDGWGLIEKEERDLTVEDIELLDRVASLSLAGNEFLQEIRAIYEKDCRLRMPSGWKP